MPSVECSTWGRRDQPYQRSPWLLNCRGPEVVAFISQVCVYVCTVGTSRTPRTCSCQLALSGTLFITETTTVQLPHHCPSTSVGSHLLDYLIIHVSLDALTKRTTPMCIRVMPFRPFPTSGPSFCPRDDPQGQAFSYAGRALCTLPPPLLSLVCSTLFKFQLENTPGFQSAPQGGLQPPHLFIF